MEALPQRVPGRIEIALLTVPREAAQEAADQLVRAGIKGILNFAPVVLEVPKEVGWRTWTSWLDLPGWLSLY